MPTFVDALLEADSGAIRIISVEKSPLFTLNPSSEGAASSRALGLLPGTRGRHGQLNDDRSDGRGECAVGPTDFDLTQDGDTTSEEGG
jgi:hypothetical protein